MQRKKYVTDGVIMSETDPQTMPDGGERRLANRSQYRRELMMFVILAFLIWPFVAVAVVGGYGFVVWMMQLVLGPPGPPQV